MSDEELITILDGLYAQYPNTRLTDGIILLYLGAFKDLPADVLRKAVTNWMLSDTSGFPPVIGQIAAEVRKVIAPWLGLTYEQAKAEKHPVWQEAHRQTFGEPRPYNPWADPSELLQAKDIPFKERDERKLFDELMAQHSTRSTADLTRLSLTFEQQTRPVALPSAQKRLAAPSRAPEPKPEPTTRREIPKVEPKPVAKPLTEQQLEARRTLLKEQAQQVLGGR